MKKLTRKDFLKTCVLAVVSVFHLPAWLRGKEVYFSQHGARRQAALYPAMGEGEQN